MKRINPYTRLQQECSEWARKVKYRDRRVMFRYPKNSLNEKWSLSDLYERVAAAKQLGYSVELEAGNDGITVKYVKDIPEPPWEIR